MNIIYAGGVYPNYKTDYQGDKIILSFDNRKGWENFKQDYKNKLKQHSGEWFYNPVFDDKNFVFTAIGYDGYLASQIEKDLTGNRDIYLGGDNHGRSSAQDTKVI